MKILFITPHLSTGGAPKYLLKKISELYTSHDVYCIEYSDLGGTEFVVQKNQIKDILDSKLITLGNDKTRLLNIIDFIDPDVIHFEELPEYFCDNKISDKIYGNIERKYKIIETSHDSSFDINNKRYLPDKFIFVSEYQKQKFKRLNIDSIVVEYPIEYKTKKNRTESLIELGLDPSKYHIFNIGLFTPRKNQAEIIEYARKFKNENVQFHFIGNQADNFKSYWEPLMDNFPSNCKWWGERSDVDKFYNAMDLFLFTSKGTIGDKETNPLVLREAIGWNIPILMYDLDVYNKMHHKFDNIKFLKFDDVDKNAQIIRSYFKPDIIQNKNKFLFVITAHPNSIVQEEITLSCIHELKKYNIDILLSTHCDVSSNLIDAVDFHIYDKNNIFSTHNFIDIAWYDSPEFKTRINLHESNNDRYHGPAVYTNYYNGISFANSLGYEYVICLNYDVSLEDSIELIPILNDVQSTDGYFSLHSIDEGSGLETVFFIIKSNVFLNTFKCIKSREEYEEYCVSNSSTVSLERLFYFILKSDLSNYMIEDRFFNEKFINFYKNENRMGEYFSVLKYVNDYNKFAIWFSSSNIKDNRIMKLSINGLTIVQCIKDIYMFDKVVSLDDIEFPINITLDLIDGSDLNNIIYTKTTVLRNKKDIKLLDRCGTFEHINQPILPEPPPEFYDDKIDSLKYTIIIVCHNRYKHIPVILNSLLCQTYSNFECIIIHDGANKEHYSVVEPYLSDQRFKYIQTDKRYNDYGMSLRNIGIEMASGDFILNTNDDNYYVPTFLEEISKALSTDKSCNFIYCDVILSTFNLENHNKKEYGLLNSKIEHSYIDIGQFLVKAELLKKHKFESVADADGILIEKIKSDIIPIYIDKVLFVHN